MKKLLVIFIVMACWGCSSTNPPDAPKASGEWKKITTEFGDIERDTY
ncbi:hypothetical protein [Aeromonas veronii]|nr:hypothetical protein [Aeromonas veronii]